MVKGRFQPKTKCRENVTMERERRWRRDGMLGKEEDEGKAGSSKPGGHSSSKQSMEASSLP